MFLNLWTKCRHTWYWFCDINAAAGMFFFFLMSKGNKIKTIYRFWQTYQKNSIFAMRLNIIPPFHNLWTHMAYWCLFTTYPNPSPNIRLIWKAVLATWYPGMYNILHKSQVVPPPAWVPPLPFYRDDFAEYANFYS